MRNINLFVEDRGHIAFLGALVGRFAKQYGIAVKISFDSAKGGHGKVISEPPILYESLSPYVLQIEAENPQP